MREILGFFSDWSTPQQHNTPENFRWTLTDKSKDDVVIYTDRQMMNDNKIGKKKIGIIYEPVEINQAVHDWVKRNYNQFDYIFTWDRELAKLSEKFIFAPFGISWIHQSMYDVYPKTKMTSIVVSEKRALVGHRLRHDAVARFRNKFDVYGRGYNRIDSLLTAFKDYRFAVVIENTNADCNLSEKLITPMLCGTVPIYYGCPSVGEFFNINGILTFNTLSELEVILNSLTPEKYEEMLPYVKENFEIAKKYQLLENTVYDKLVELDVIKETEPCQPSIQNPT